MIDIHIHIIPGVDDGSRNLEMSLAMARMAYETGVDHMIVTPHSYPGIYDNYAGERLEAKYRSLKEAVKAQRIPLNLYRGMEIYGTEDTVSLLKEHKLWTLNHTKYILIEFGFHEDPDFVNTILKDCKEAGYDPVVAHPARYSFVQQDPQLVYDWVQKGYGIQLNKGSILGSNGRRCQECAVSLLRHGLVHCVASDAHRMGWREPDMDRVTDELENRFGEEYTYMLVEENPGRILDGRRLVGYDPIPYIAEEDTE